MEQFVLKQLVLVNSLHMRLMFLILFDTSDFYGPYSLIVTMWTVKLILQIENKKRIRFILKKICNLIDLTVMLKFL